MFNSDTKTGNILLVFLLLAIGLSWVFSFTLIDDQLFFDFYADQMAYERVLEQIELQKQWAWLQYVLLPVVYLLKFLLVASVLSIGLFLADVRAQFSDAFRVALEAEFVFFIPLIVKLIWFGAIHRDYSIMELTQFAPLSLQHLVPLDDSQQWLAPLVQGISIFQLAYWALLAFGVAKIYSRSFQSSFGLVAASYGSGWLTMQVLIIFLGVNFSG